MLLLLLLIIMIMITIIITITITTTITITITITRTIIWSRAELDALREEGPGPPLRDRRHDWPDCVRVTGLGRDVRAAQLWGQGGRHGRRVAARKLLTGTLLM